MPGGQLIGPNVSELIAECAFTAEKCATPDDVANTTHTTPYSRRS
ncbi:hypothetical protein [Halobellus captivus]